MTVFGATRATTLLLRMFTSLSSLLNRRTPQQSTKTKRRWESNESVNEEEEDCEPTDLLQTPPNKRARICRSEHSQESSTPFGKVSSWVKQTAKKIFSSFADKYNFWQDEVHDDSSDDIAPPLCQRPVMKHSSLEQGTSRTFMTRDRDEATPSYSKDISFDDDLTRRLPHEYALARRHIYDPSRYDNDTTQDALTKEFWPLTSTSKRTGAGNAAAVNNTSNNVRKTKASGPAEEMKSFKNNRPESMVNSVIRLQEREKYKQLLAHYTSVTPSSGELSGIGTRSVVQKPGNYNRIEISTKRNARREQSLLSPTSFPRRSSHPTTIIDLPQPVRLQVSPSRSQPRTVDVSRTVSTDTRKGILDSGISSRKTTSTRSFNLLDDCWIAKWKETLSTESLERQRKITKETLKLEAIRKEKDYEKISEEVQARMQGKRTSPVIEIDSFKELTSEMNCAIDKALGRGAPNEQLVVTSLGGITRGDIATLGQQNWLNDEVINSYFHMIADRSKKGGPKVHSFNTFFYLKLVKHGHTSLRRWTKKVDLFSMDLVLVPVHLGMHWCLAVIDFKSKTISYYDSLRGENGQCLQSLRDYLCAESLDKKKTKFDLTGWKSDTPKDVPEQLNGCDCGVFICKYAEYISRRANLDFTQYNMPYFRRRMVYEILSKTLL